MSKELALDDKKQVKQPKPIDKALEKGRPVGPTSSASEVLRLQKQVGNQAVQRLIAQRSADGGFDLDETTANRINQARGGGQALDGAVQTQMGEAMGHDFSNVRVHTSPEANDLNQELSAKAFTTGQDVFFKQGEYDPGSSGGKELLAHELTHVVQQSSGAVGGSGGAMRVTPPGDAFEQEADNVAQSVTSTEAQVQRAMPEEEVMEKRDDSIQRAMPEEEVMEKRDDSIQRAMPEEEVMEKRDDSIQRAMPEEEVMEKRDDSIQRAMPEEEVMEKRDDTVQRNASPDEEIL